MYKYFTCMHVCLAHVCLLDSLELRLQVVINHHMGAGNSAVSSARATGSQPGGLTAAPSRWLNTRENHLLITRVLKIKS